MPEPIESAYFNWLCAKVNSLENPTPSLTFWTLLKELHNTEFIWLLSGDDNRVQDGIDLRVEFLRESFIYGEADLEWLNLGCSLLEMFIAFSRRASFETDRSSREWFWEFMNNLGFSEFNDANVPSYYPIIAETLYRLVWRTYEYNGVGGLFPLVNSTEDQRKVEIWYQFAQYLVDKEQS